MEAITVKRYTIIFAGLIAALSCSNTLAATRAQKTAAARTKTSPTARPQQKKKLTPKTSTITFFYTLDEAKQHCPDPEESDFFYTSGSAISQFSTNDNKSRWFIADCGSTACNYQVPADMDDQSGKINDADWRTMVDAEGEAYGYVSDNNTVCYYQYQGGASNVMINANLHYMVPY